MRPAVGGVRSQGSRTVNGALLRPQRLRRLNTECPTRGDHACKQAHAKHERHIGEEHRHVPERGPTLDATETTITLRRDVRQDSNQESASHDTNHHVRERPPARADKCVAKRLRVTPPCTLPRST